MLALVFLVLTFVLLKSLRVADWLATVAAFGAAYLTRIYLPGFDIAYAGVGVTVVIAAVVLCPFWLGPILIHRTQRQNASPSLENFDPAVHTVPESTAVALQESESTLMSCGFTKVGDYFQPSSMKSMTTRVGLFERPATRQRAIIVGMYGTDEQAKLMMHYVEVCAEYADGRSLLANNSPLLGCYAPVAGKTVERFPDVRDPGRLVRLHEGLMQQRAAVEEAQELEQGIDGAQYLVDSMLREFSDQVAAGYLQLDESANAYRPTIKGALLMTWKMVAPISTIRMRRARKRAAQLIEQLGVTGPDVSVASVPALKQNTAWAVGLLLLLLGGYAYGADTVADRLFSNSDPSAPIGMSSDFTVPADFPGAVKALEALTGVVAEQLVVMDSLGFPVQTEGAMFGIQPARADSLLESAQSVFLERGFFLFRHEPNYGIGGKPDEIGLVPLADQYAVVKRVGTNGVNHDLAPDHIIAWLRELERDAPFILTGIGYDHVEGRFLRPIGAQADSVAARLHRFCPDVVDQGTGSVRELANEIGRLNTFFCWWD